MPNDLTACPSPAPFSLLDQVPAAVAVVDGSDRLVYWSPAVGKLFDLPATVCDSPVSAVVPRHSLPHWERAAAVARERGTWTGELRLQTVRGEDRVVEVHCTRRSDCHGGLVLAFTDLTEARRHQVAERQAWRRRAAERLAAAAVQEFESSGEHSQRGRVREFELLSQAAETVVEGPGHSFDGWCVLLVGGRPLARECLRLLLEARGITVLAAADGFEAVERLEADRAGVRAALIDADLPGWGASAALTALRRKDPLLPAVLLGSADDKRLADEIQVAVPKPFRIEDVLWALRESQAAAVQS